MIVIRRSFMQKILHLLIHPDRWYKWIYTFFLDMRYGSMYLGKTIINENPIRGWNASQNSNYQALEILFSKITIYPNDVIVDVGCGLGRVFNWLLHKNIKNKLIGIDVDATVIRLTKKRLKKYSQVTCLEGDVEKNPSLLSEGSIFYLFNPFTQKIVASVAKNLLDSAHFSSTEKPKRILIIYYNCEHLDVFAEDPRWKINYLGPISISGLPAAIIELKI